MIARSGPVRRQFQSCDACRQRRKACDAGQLGLVSKGAPSSGSDHGACSACQKKGTRCTFNWLLRTEKRSATVSASASKSREPRNANAKASSESTGRPGVQSPDLAKDETGVAPIDEADHSDLTRLQHDWLGVSAACIPPIPTSESCFMGDAIHTLSWNGVPQLLTTDASGTSSDSHSDHGILAMSHREQLHSGFPSHKPTAQSAYGYRLGSPTDPLTDQGLCIRHESTSVSDVFVRIYQQNLEHALAGWSTASNSPYVLSRQNLRGLGGGRARPAEDNYYERALRMDGCISHLHLPNTPLLSVSQHVQVSEALQKAILAYSSQWNSPHSRRASPGTLSDSLAISLHRMMQKTLWHEARAALDSIENLSCFKSILASLIFSAITPPFTAEELRKVSSNGGNPRTDPLKHALHELADWRRKLSQAMRQNDATNPHRKNLLTAFLNEFGILYWLGVMCDTASAAVTEEPLVISDEDCALSQDNFTNPSSTEAVSLPSPVDEHPATPTKKTVSLWTDTLVLRTRAYYTTSHSWPLTTSQIGGLLQQAVPVKTLLYRRVAQLKTLAKQQATSNAIEGALQDALVTYQQWNVIFGDFMANCAGDWKRLPEGLCSWHVVLAVHWHYGALLLSDQIRRVDRDDLGDACRSQIRASSFLTAEMSLTNARSIAQLAQRYAERDAGAHTQNAKAMTTEPWSAMTLRALAKAGAEIVTTISGEPNMNLAHFAAHRGIAPFDLMADAQSIIDALYEFATRCSLAGPAAASLEHKLMTLSIAPSAPPAPLLPV